MSASAGSLNERKIATAALQKTKGKPSSPEWVRSLPEHTLILLDGFGYIFRAYYSRVSFVSRTGIPTGAFTVFGNMVLSLLNLFEPRYLAVVFESRTGNVRTEILPELKANRTPPPDDLLRQIPLIESLIRGLGIPLLWIDGYEADDTIAALAKGWLAEQPDSRVLVLSTDKDLLAIVSDRLQVYDPMLQKLFGPREVREKWGVDPDQISDLLALTGDSVDNIAGVPGIGPKTAASLLSGGLHVEDLVTRPERVFPERLRPKIIENRELILKNKSVTILHEGIPVDASPEALAIGSPHEEDLRRLAESLETATLLSRILAWTRRTSGDRPSKEDSPSAEPAVSPPPSRGVVIDPDWGTGVWDGTRWQWRPSGNDCRFLEDFHGSRTPFWTSSLTALLRACPELCEEPLPDFDMELAGYLLDPGRRDYRQGALKDQLFLSGDPGNTDEKGSLVFTILEKLEREIERQSLGSLLRNLEIPVARILVKMERAGVMVSRSRIGEVRATIEGRIGGLEEEIHKAAGGPFSILSPKQVGEVLFGKLGLPTPRKGGKKGSTPSTDEETLQALSPLHPLPRLIMEYRQLRKFLSTYIAPMEEGTGPDGRLHGQFNQTVAATGRLSSSGPNLQNIPAKTDLGLLIRRCFVAPEGALLLSADYSQIELRLLAHLSQDPYLLQAFAENQDIHSRTALLLFGEPVTPETRRRAKTFNFGILYGMSSFSLAQDLGIVPTEAQEIIDRYFRVFSRVGPYFEQIRKEAEKTGRISTILGRIRPIPEILSDNRRIHEYGERMAVNSVLQGSAADLVKKAMVDLDNRLGRTKGGVRLLIQVHDELLLEVPKAELETASATVRESMEGAVSLSVPLIVRLGTGRDWVEAHPV